MGGRMNHITRWILFLSSAILLAAPRGFAIEVQTGTEDFTLRIDSDLQVRAEGSFDGPPPTATSGAAPSGHFNTDFFLRRASLTAAGTAYKHFTYYLKLESGRFGARGNYAVASLIQDMYIGVVPFQDFNIEAGFLKSPLSHAALDSAPQANSLEGVSDILFYPNARAQRQDGVQVRGLFFDRRILIRGGVYEGARSGVSGGTPVTTAFAPPFVNPQGVPLVAGMARLNLIGYEASYTYPQIYLDGSSHLSVGVGGQYQAHAGALKDTVSGSFYDYSALAADLFVDMALPNDSEAVLTLGGYRFDYGTGKAKTGNGLHGDLGYRWGPIEPQANFYWYNSDTRVNSFLRVAGGLTYFFNRHRAKIMAEFQSTIANGVLPDTPGLPATPRLHTILLQGQLAL